MSSEERLKLLRKASNALQKATVAYVNSAVEVFPFGSVYSKLNELRNDLDLVLEGVEAQ